MDSDPPKDASFQVLELLRNERTKELLAEQYNLLCVRVKSFRETEPGYEKELDLEDGEIHPAMSEAFDLGVEVTEDNEEIRDLLQEFSKFSRMSTLAVRDNE